MKQRPNEVTELITASQAGGCLYETPAMTTKIANYILHLETKLDKISVSCCKSGHDISLIKVILEAD
jgi:hypothetical protein